MFYSIISLRGNIFVLASKDVATEVLTLRAEAQAAREAARLSQDKLKELKRQVDTTKKQCTEKDRSLCDTIDTTGLEIIFKIDKVFNSTISTHFTTIHTFKVHTSSYPPGKYVPVSQTVQYYTYKVNSLSVR